MLSEKNYELCHFYFCSFPEYWHKFYKLIAVLSVTLWILQTMVITDEEDGLLALEYGYSWTFWVESGSLWTFSLAFIDSAYLTYFSFPLWCFPFGVAFGIKYLVMLLIIWNWCHLKIIIQSNRIFTLCLAWWNMVNILFSSLPYRPCYGMYVDSTKVFQPSFKMQGC